jgi:predicted lipoprotein with Yx(FWY)xxD motif
MGPTQRLSLAVLAACALLVPGCGGGGYGSRGAPAPATSPPTQTTRPAPAKPKPTGTRVTLQGSDYGKILFDGRGQAIYLFGKEKTTRPECYGDCATAWPPVYTKGEPRAGRGIEAGLLGTTKRRDGRLQVTYGGHPLYFYAHEGRREVRCHNVFLNGGLWRVVGADGRAVE